MSHAIPGAVVRQSERLVLRRFTLDDAALIVEMLNEPGWLRFIGDRGVRTLEDAPAYMERALFGPYARQGYGFYRVELRLDGTPVGMCGLVRREALDDADIGFALLARYAGHGYALEAATEVVRHAREDLGFTRLLAITNPDNVRSIALLEKLGMRFERMFRMPDSDEELKLFAMSLDGSPNSR